MSSSKSLNVLVLGGSRHIGYHAALRLLGTGATVTFLLRNPSCFDNDTEIQKYVSSQNVNLVKGDATVRSDVQNVWNVATAGGESSVHVVLCTIGFSGSPSFNILKGVQISPPNLLTLSLINLFSTMPPSTSSDTTPKFVIISATGVNQKSRAAAPILLRPLYSYVIQAPLQDKHGAERVVSVLGGWNWDNAIPEPEDQILDRSGKWLETEGMPKAGTLKNVVVVRPALLDDGDCRADKVVTGKAPYRVGEGEVGGWSVSRKDVAHFVVEMVTTEAKWDEYKDKQISIAY